LFPGCSSHEELYNLSINQVKYLRALTTYYPLSEILQRSLMTIYLQTDLFWGTLARLRLRWNRDFQQVSDCNMETGSFRWFLGGQLNVSGKARLHLTFTEVEITWSNILVLIILISVTWSNNDMVKQGKGKKS
jgi:hypothetical protein